MQSIEDADAPNRMINDLGDAFFPDGEEDARYFAREHDAWPVSDPKPLHVGPVCRCLPCCCRDGQGHKHADWIAWEERQRGRGGSA